MSHFDAIRRHGTAVRQCRDRRLPRRADRPARIPALRRGAWHGRTAPLCAHAQPSARGGQPHHRGDGRHARAGGPDRPADRGRHRERLSAEPVRGIPRGLRPDAACCSRRSRKAGAPNADGSVWTFKIRRGVKFHDGRALTAHDVVGDHGSARRSRERLDRPVGLRRHALERRRAGARRRHGRVSARCAERQLPLPGLVRQLQRDHLARGLCRRLRAQLQRYRPLPARAVHREGARLLRAQRPILGCEGDAGPRAVQFLRQYPGAGARHAGRPARRAAARAGAGRPSAARRSRA